MIYNVSLEILIFEFSCGYIYIYMYMYTIILHTYIHIPFNNIQRIFICDTLYVACMHEKKANGQPLFGTL
jgi:hypothetical protein